MADRDPGKNDSKPSVLGKPPAGADAQTKDTETETEGSELAPVSKRNKTDIPDSVFDVNTAPSEQVDEPDGDNDGDAEAKPASEPETPEPAEADVDAKAEAEPVEANSEPATTPDEAGDNKKSEPEPGSLNKTPPEPVSANPDIEQAPAPRPAARARAERSHSPTFYVAGFWRRLLAAAIDSAVILPISLLMCWLAGTLTGLNLPAARHRGIDFWLDLLLSSDPALLGAIGLCLAVAAVYLLVFQITQGRTLGMKVLKIRIIDVYGDQPSTMHSALRTAGYLAGVGTLGLGFLWVGFDSEKRGLHDWISSTYVVKA